MIACSLLALSAGYFVFAHASGQKAGDVRQIGRIAGIIVMLVALVGTVCGVACKAGKADCGMRAAKSSYCPITARLLK